MRWEGDAMGMETVAVGPGVSACSRSNVATVTRPGAVSSAQSIDSLLERANKNLQDLNHFSFASDNNVAELFFT